MEAGGLRNLGEDSRCSKLLNRLVNGAEGTLQRLQDCLAKMQIIV